jgi:homoserine dehydrogenase
VHDFWISGDFFATHVFYDRYLSHPVATALNNEEPILNRPYINLAVAGFGTVGTGLAKAIRENLDWIGRRLGKTLRIHTVLVRDIHKKRHFIPDPETIFTDDPETFLATSDIDIVVELIGGTGLAFEIISRSLSQGRSVVTANKALLAERGGELFALAAENNAGLYYEASVAGGIPIVQTLKESLAGNKIKNLLGILNGTANYILSEMTAKGLDFQTALSMAQAKGYAEADPTFDIEGIDAAHKLTLLIRLAHGQDFPFVDLAVTGISEVEAQDIALGGEFGYKLKLLAQVSDSGGKLQAGVFPAFISKNHMLAKVEGPFNSILLEGNVVGPIMLYGQGAGDLATGSAVLADVMALSKNPNPPNNTGFPEPILPLAAILDPMLSLSGHYFRFTVQDRPGVLSAISGIMGNNAISIAQAVQKPIADPGQGVSIVFLSHKALLRDVQKAITEIDGCDFIMAPTVHYRIV